LSLANKAWLQLGEDQRYQLHPLLQHYGLERLQADEQVWLQAKDRHANYYVKFASEQYQRLCSSEQQAALAAFDQELSTNIRTTWDRLVAQNRWEQILDHMVLGLYKFGSISWRWEEISAMFRDARIQLAKSQQKEQILTWVIIGTLELHSELMTTSANFIEDMEIRLERLWQITLEENLIEAMGFWFFRGSGALRWLMASYIAFLVPAALQPPAAARLDLGEAYLAAAFFAGIVALGFHQIWHRATKAYRLLLAVLLVALLYANLALIRRGAGFSRAVAERPEHGVHDLPECLSCGRHEPQRQEHGQEAVVGEGVHLLSRGGGEPRGDETVPVQRGNGDEVE